MIRLKTRALAPRNTVLLGALALLLMPTLARGQGLDPELQELIRQVGRNMTESEKAIDRIDAETQGKTSKQSAEDIQKIAERLMRRGQQITKDIDEVIEKLPSSGGGGGGGGQSKSQGQGQSAPDSQGQDQSQARDRNQSEGQQGQQGQQGQEQEGEGQSEGEQKGQPQGQGQQPKGGEDSKRKGQQRGAQPRPEDQRGELRPLPTDAERWGFLPKQVRQRLIDRNFRQFTPEYQAEIRDYFLKLNKARKRN